VSLNSILKDFRNWVAPDPPDAVPLTVSAARALTQRDSLSRLLTYREVDDHYFVTLDDGERFASGFVLGLNPMMVAGLDAEAQIEAAINACPPDTVLQFGVISSPQIRGFLDQWAEARLAKTSNPLLQQITRRRREFMLETATGPSMLMRSRLHPRLLQWYLSVRLSFKGDPTDSDELSAFIEQMSDLRNTITGALKAGGIATWNIPEEGLRFLLRELLNPHLPPDERIETAQQQVPMHLDLIDRDTRVTVDNKGVLGFSGGAEEPEVLVRCLTTDAAPRELALPVMDRVLGKPSSDERISCPFWAYTTIHVLDTDKGQDSLSIKRAALTRQANAGGNWFRSMMSHLNERKENVEATLEEIPKGHKLVRAYSGVNIYCTRAEIKTQTEYVKGLWRNTGFRFSEESYIALPVFLASLPLQYQPAMDPPNHGLQRAWMMTSVNAASLVMLQGDWQGTGPDHGGPLLISRKGRLASIDLLETGSNYNFVVVAQSGSGKSFIANEIVCDFLSKNGIARVIDVGRSYTRFCEVMNGQNVVFEHDKPMSVNPFSGLASERDLDEMMPMLQDLVRLMAYPLTPEDQTPAFEYKLIAKAIRESWLEKREATEIGDVAHWLEEFDDGKNRGKDLALQLEQFTTGQYRRWFSGPRTVSFDNPFVVVELEELKNDPILQAVVLQLVMYQITTEMYLSDRAIPKMLLIDEAWDLMGGIKTGRFIESAFRRARKYGGIVGVATQSFEDFEKSDAARAAISNAAWQLILAQKPESLQHAVDKKLLMGSEGLIDLVRTVHTSKDRDYSELFIRGGEGMGLYKFIVDRWSYYTFTSNPKDVPRIDALVREGKSLVEAIDILASADHEAMYGKKTEEAA
jgi:conjugal transfer ATP-binding protein TraC